jgi:EAL domain-containing protein (putative c-di-GMP-specific phosphodiesterase class I)
MPSPNGCLRCQSPTYGRPEQSGTSSALLLGPQDADSAAALRQVLDQAGLSFTEIGPVIRLSGSFRSLSHTLARLLTEQLSPYARSCIRAAYAPQGAETLEQALSAFLFAEPLTELLKHSGHAWVRDALAENWLFSVFHPILDAHSGSFFGYEALLRARDPETGRIIGAGPLLQACEALHLEHQLDQRARQAAIQGGAAYITGAKKLFINFLPNTIYEPAICLRTTMETAAKCGVPLSQLVLEVVETESIPDMKHLQRILAYYRERGISTAIDDMGAGFTSLDYISALRPDYVKIDRALIEEAEHGPAERRKLAEIIGVAHEFGSHVIAEGIETQTQLELCQEMRADYVQGFLFARPACPPEEIHYPAMA